MLASYDVDIRGVHFDELGRTNKKIAADKILTGQPASDTSGDGIVNVHICRPDNRVGRRRIASNCRRPRSGSRIHESNSPAWVAPPSSQTQRRLNGFVAPDFLRVAADATAPPGTAASLFALRGCLCRQA